MNRRVVWILVAAVVSVALLAWVLFGPGRQTVMPGGIVEVAALPTPTPAPEPVAEVAPPAPEKHFQQKIPSGC